MNSGPFTASRASWEDKIWPTSLDASAPPCSQKSSDYPPCYLSARSSPSGLTAVYLNRCGRGCPLTREFFQHPASGNGRTGQWRFRCPLKAEALLSSLFQLSGGRLRDIT